MDMFWQIVLLSLSIICFIISLYFLFSRKYRRENHNSIKHYSDKRDKLTEKDAEIDEDENNSTGYALESFSIGKFIGASVVFIVGINVFGAVKETINSQINSTAVESQAIGQVSAILGLTTIFFAIAMVTFIIGLFNSVIDEEEPKKQKYEKDKHSNTKHYTQIRDKVSKK